MTQPSRLFASPSEIARPKVSYADIPMGTRHPTAGRYRMPATLPGDEAPKSLPAGVEPYVSRGIQSMTNLAGSISDTRALGIWELRQSAIGLGLNEDLRTELAAVVHRGRSEGVDFQALREHPAFAAELDALIERAKDISGANAARDAGIYLHDVWEELGKTNTFSGTEPEREHFDSLGDLLSAAGMEIIPELVERTVRNTAVQAAGRFDNILLHQRSGRLLMADLKTKRKPFWSFLEMDAQLAGYANADWMLEWDVDTRGDSPDVGPYYVPGPREHVDLTGGVILHLPSDGSEPRLRRADLVRGWKALQLARQVCDVRSDGKSAARMAESYWPVS